MATPRPNRPTAADAGPSDDVGGGAFRRRAAINVGAGYSRLVQAMKVVLPLTALGILALVASWSVIVEPTARKFAEHPGDSELLRPRYYSVDEKGQPFSFTAKRAKESDAQTSIINLEEPEAEMTELGGGWVTLRSLKGVYNRETRLLHMIGDVRILRDDGAEYHTEEAFSDISSGTAWGDSRIVGQGPQGEVAGDGFRMTDRGKTMTFINQSAVSTPTGAPRAGVVVAPVAPSAPAQIVSPAPASPAVVSPVAASPTPAAISPPAAEPAPAPAPSSDDFPPVVSPPPPAPTPEIAPSPPAKAAAPAAPPSPTVWTPPPPKRKPIPPKRK